MSPENLHRTHGRRRTMSTRAQYILLLILSTRRSGTPGQLEVVSAEFVARTLHREDSSKKSSSSPLKYYRRVKGKFLTVGALTVDHLFWSVGYGAIGLS